MDIAHNNAKQISNVVMHILIMDMHTLLPLPCQRLFETHAYNVVGKCFYMSQIDDWPFHQTLCFVNYSYDC